MSFPDLLSSSRCVSGAEDSDAAVMGEQPEFLDSNHSLQMLQPAPLRLLRGSVILGSSRTLNDLAAYDHIWRVLQENYGDVGAIIGQRESFYCAHDIAAAFVDSTANQCFLSSPISFGSNFVPIAVAFLLLLCGKVRTVFVISDQGDHSRTMLQMLLLTCNAATSYLLDTICRTDNSAIKQTFAECIMKISNNPAHATFRFVSASDSHIWRNFSDAFLLWDAPVPESGTLSDQLKHASPCVLVLSCMPLSLAQLCDASDLVPMSTQSLELKMAHLSEEINKIMVRIKRLQLQQNETCLSGNDLHVFQTKAHATEIVALNLQMCEKLAQMESQTLQAICIQRAFLYVPQHEYRSAVCYHDRGVLRPSWTMSTADPSSIDATRRILKLFRNLPSSPRDARLAFFYFRHDHNLHVMNALCASLGLECLRYSRSLDSFSKKKHVVILCTLGDCLLSHVLLPKPQVALFFVEPCLEPDIYYIQAAMFLFQRQLCGFDSEFDETESEYPSVYLPRSLLENISHSEFSTHCVTPPSYRSFFRPICRSITLKVWLNCIDDLFSFIWCLPFTHFIRLVQENRWRFRSRSLRFQACVAIFFVASC